MKQVLFFMDEMALDVHSATQKSHLGTTTIGEFIKDSGNSPIRVFDMEDGEFHVEVGSGSNHMFMTGVPA